MNSDYKIANSPIYWFFGFVFGIAVTYWSGYESEWVGLVFAGVIWSIFVQIPIGVILDSFINFRSYKTNLIGWSLSIALLVIYEANINGWSSFNSNVDIYETIYIWTLFSLFFGYVVIGVVIGEFLKEKNKNAIL